MWNRRLQRRPNMRYQLSPRRINMKRLFPSTALALFIGIGLLPMSGNTFADNSWDKLQPDRDEVIASLNVVELLKRHHYSKPPLDDARSVIIYDSYLKLLDPSRSYFMASDIAELDDLWRKRVKDEVLRQKIAGKDSKQIQETLTKRYKNQLARLDQTRAA